LADYQTRTITLLRRPLGEADYLGVFLSADRGKIRAVARGTRKPKSKLAPAVQPFVLAEIMFGRGKGLDVVAQVQVEEPFPPLRSDLRRLAHASYWCELVDRGVEEGQPVPRVFLLLQACLRLGAVCDDLVLLTGYLELHLMRELGFEMSLYQCPECGGEPPEGATLWAPALGGVVCRSCVGTTAGMRAMGGAALSLLREIAASRAGELMSLAPERAALREGEGLVRRYVEYHIDAPLKSLAFLRRVEGLME